MKPLKIIGYALGGIVALVLLGAIAVLLLVDPNRYRATIEARVTESTGHPFTITGKLKLSLFPWLALDVGQFTIGNPPGFGSEPLLAAERVRVGARLLPLLGGRLEVDRVALDGLAINLVRRADGHSNWESPPKPEAPPPGKAGSLEGLSIAGIDVSGATLSYRNEADKTLTRVRDLALHTGALGPSRPTDVALDARIDAGDGTPATRLALRTRATADTEQARATLSAFKLSGERIPAAAGKAVPFSIAAPQIAFDWRQGTLSPATLDVKVGELPLALQVAGERLFGARLVTGHLAIPAVSLRAVAASLGVELPATRAADAFTHFAAAADFRATERAVALEAIDVTLDHTRLRGKVALEDLANAAFDVDLHADAIDLDAYRAAPAPAPAPGKPAAPVPLPVAALRALNGHGTLALDRATLAGLALTELRVPFSAHGGDVRLSPSARAFGGTSAGDIRLDAAREAVTLTLSEDVKGVDIGAAVKAYAKSDRLSGRANAVVKLAGSGATDVALLGSLSGPIDFEVKNGALEGLDVAYELERAQALLEKQVPPARTGPERTSFDVLSGHSHLEHGVLTSDPLRLETQVLKVAGKGTFRLGDQAVAYQLVARIQQVPPAGGGGALAKLHSAEIPVEITGTVHDYKVRPDLSGIVKGRLKEELDKHKDELRDKLKDKLKDLFSH